MEKRTLSVLILLTSITAFIYAHYQALWESDEIIMLVFSGIAYGLFILSAVADFERPKRPWCTKSSIKTRIGCLQSQDTYGEPVGGPLDLELTIVSNYRLTPQITLSRPASGDQVVEMTCSICGEELQIVVHSRNRQWLKGIFRNLLYGVPIIGGWAVASYFLHNSSNEDDEKLLLLLGLFGVFVTGAFGVAFWKDYLRNDFDISADIVEGPPEHELYDLNGNMRSSGVV